MRELPGFYYDAEKNRYFPIKGRIPGSSSSSSSTADSKPTRVIPYKRRSGPSTSRLLGARELNGNSISLNKGNGNFKEEFQKIQATRPVVLRYQNTHNTGDSALEQMQIYAQTPEGQTRTEVLLAGSVNGSLSMLGVGKEGKLFNNGIRCTPDPVWPSIKENETNASEAPRQVRRLPGLSLPLGSSITSIKFIEKYSTSDEQVTSRHALITTLGSAGTSGALYLLNLCQALDLNETFRSIQERTQTMASLDYTIWTADCNSNAAQTVLGTNRGVALINMETKKLSWPLRSASDVLSLQFDQSGNSVLCGLRNGAIVTIDVREKQNVRPRCIRHRIPYSSLGKLRQTSNKKMFELKGNICPSRDIYMTSSVSCLLSLKLYDQYFMASSMDGSIMLYDHRLVKRGAVQSYEGHVNSHTRLQLGIDPSERFVMSGGEDCYMRVWSIKSGELLMQNKFSDSVFSTLCWPRTEHMIDDADHNFGAWLGSQEGLYHMRCS